jgi:hypothetical protein
MPWDLEQASNILDHEQFPFNELDCPKLGKISINYLLENCRLRSTQAILWKNQEGKLHVQSPAFPLPIN